MEELNNMQKKCYVTIDFEDFSHDWLGNLVKVCLEAAQPHCISFDVN